MKTHNLILSGKLKYRILRHGLFCLCILLYSFLRIGIMFPVNSFWATFYSFFSFTLYWTSLILFYSYITAYVLVPKFYNRKKYISFAITLLLLTIFLYVINELQAYYQVNKTFSNIAGIRFGTFFPGAAVVRILGNPPLVCGLLLSLKSLKSWYLKKMENEELTRANTNAELQLLKSQIHPHFLFNTLNNIYSYSMNNKPEAAGLVNKLKNTIHYMVQECNRAHVPLNNELNMIANYIELEKVRYGNRLSMQVELMSSGDNLLIAPLLMIPFIENSFKHGVSQMLKHPRITLKIYSEGNILYFLLSNSKPPTPEKQGTRKGIGLENVKKRLELLYPGKYVLEILNTEESFTVRMEIVLTRFILRETQSGLLTSPEINPTISYATPYQNNLSGGG